MTLSTSKLSFEDCYAVMDAALLDPEGIRVRLQTKGQAQYFRLRCHRARALDRRENSTTYEEGHPLHGKSNYDRLVIRLKDGDGDSIENRDGPFDEIWLHFDCNLVMPLDIQSLSGHRVVLSIPKHEPRQLEAPPKAPTDDELGDAFDKIETVPETRGGLRRV